MFCSRTNADKCGTWHEDEFSSSSMSVTAFHVGKWVKFQLITGKSWNGVRAITRDGERRRAVCELSAAAGRRGSNSSEEK